MTQSALLTSISPQNDDHSLNISLKQLKNQVIGHVDQKMDYIEQDATQCLLTILTSDTSNQNKLEAAQILLSFAHGTFKSIERLLKSPVLETLSELLSTNKDNILTTYYLKIVVTMLKKCKSCIVDNTTDERISLLVANLLADSSSSLAVWEQCFRLIKLLIPSNSCMHTGKLAPLVMAKVCYLCSIYVNTHKHRRETEHAISALAHVLNKSQAQILFENNEQTIVNFQTRMRGGEFLRLLISMTRDENPHIRLAVVDLLSALQSWTKTKQQHEMIIRPILPTLLPLFDMLIDDSRVSLALARICHNDENIAARAAEFHAIKNIMETLKKINSDHYTEIMADMFMALAGMAIHEDKYRQEIVSEGGLKMIVEAMKLQNDFFNDGLSDDGLRRLKIAACHVLRSLSRSINLLRTGLDSNDLADGVIDLLKYTNNSNTYNKIDSNEVKSSIMAGVCNLILEFSPLSAPLLEKGIMNHIYEGCHSNYTPLRQNSLWAIKHAVFQASEDFKLKVVRELGASYMLELCKDEELTSQEQAMDCLRNTICGSEPVINEIMNQVGKEELFELIEEKICPSSNAYQNYPVIIQSAIYTLVHIASGSETHREMILNHSNLLEKLLPLLEHEDAQIRVAIAWVVINLTWIEHHSDPQQTENCRRRAQALIGLGFQNALEKTQNDVVGDVRERSKTALSQIEKLIRSDSYHPNFRPSGSSSEVV